MKPIPLPQLPQMRCDDGCGECCGIVGCSSHEFVQVSRVVKARGIKPVRQGSTCPLFLGGRCSVYEVRPACCRVFGHTPELTCPRGYNVATPPEHVKAHMATSLRGGIRSARFLHELVYSLDEVHRLFQEALQGNVPMPQEQT